MRAGSSSGRRPDREAPRAGGFHRRRRGVRWARRGAGQAPGTATPGQAATDGADPPTVPPPSGQDGGQPLGRVCSQSPRPTGAPRRRVRRPNSPTRHEQVVADGCGEDVCVLGEITDGAALLGFRIPVDRNVVEDDLAAAGRSIPASVISSAVLPTPLPPLTTSRSPGRNPIVTG